MKKVAAFIKGKIITGVIVIVPVAIIVIILGDTITKLMSFTAPLTSNMDNGVPILKTLAAILILVLILGLIFFVSGLILKTYLGTIFKKWIDRTILERIPFFNTLNSVVQQLTGVEKGNYTAVEVSLYENENKVLGIHTETLSDGRYVVYIPLSPIVNIGQTHIVPSKNVKVLDITMKDLLEVVSKIGFESQKIL